MCPGGPYDVQRSCEIPGNATGSTIAQHLGWTGMSPTSRGGGAREGVVRSGNTTRERRRAMRDDLGSRPPKATREKLFGLASLRDDSLISAAEFEALRARVLKGRTSAAVAGKSTPQI